jgi:hypothetical protein
MEPRSAAVRWEYNVQKLGPSASLTHCDFLNQLGRDGWELVAFQPSGERAYPGEGTYFFKRSLPTA